MNTNASQPGPRLVPLTQTEAQQRFHALNAHLAAQGGAISHADAREWAMTGLAGGECRAVETQLRLWLGQPAPALARVEWLRFLGTALWRQRNLPEAVECFRAALAVLTDGAIASGAVLRRRPVCFDPELGLQLVWRTLASLAAEGVHAFATAGTLLGLERDGCLLAHDKDIDIGLLASELPAADRLLRAAGWRRSEVGHSFVNVISYQDPVTGMELDLLGFARERGSDKLLGGFWLEGVPWAWQRVLEYPMPDALRHAPSPAGPIWRLPDPDAWLSALYGDWRSPDEDFDSVISARNLRGFALLTQCYAFSRVVLRWQNMELSKALSLTRQILRRHTPDDPLLLRVDARLLDAMHK